jgi:hypothetical protein
VSDAGSSCAGDEGPALVMQQQQQQWGAASVAPSRAPTDISFMVSPYPQEGAEEGAKQWLAIDEGVERTQLGTVAACFGMATGQLGAAEQLNAAGGTLWGPQGLDAAVGHEAGARQEQPAPPQK